MAPDEPMQDTDVSGERRIIQRKGVGAIGSPGAWPHGESPVAPDEPTGPCWSVGALTGVLTRAAVKRAEAEYSAPDDLTPIRLMRRFIW